MSRQQPRALMARRRHLSKAPIREAVLDVRVETEEPADRTMLSVSIGTEGDPSYAARLADGTAYGFVRWGDTFPIALKDLLRRLYFPDG